jgi:hypothetical protein
MAALPVGMPPPVPCGVDLRARRLDKVPRGIGHGARSIGSAQERTPTTYKQYPQGCTVRTAARATSPDERGDLARSGGRPHQTLPLTTAARLWPPPAARSLRPGPGPVARARSIRSGPGPVARARSVRSAPPGPVGRGARQVSAGGSPPGRAGRRRDGGRRPPSRRRAVPSRSGTAGRGDGAARSRAAAADGRSWSVRKTWQGPSNRVRRGRFTSPSGCPYERPAACRTFPRLSPDVTAARRSSGRDEQRAMKR